MSRSAERPNDLEEGAPAVDTTSAERIAAPSPDLCTETTDPTSIPSESSNGAEPFTGTLAERMAGHIGRIASGGAERLSQPSGNGFTDYLLAKKREGRL